MPDDKAEDYAPEIVLASTLRLRGGDLIELAGAMMAERRERRDGAVSTYTLEQIERAIADLTKTLTEFKARTAPAKKEEDAQ